MDQAFVDPLTDLLWGLLFWVLALFLVTAGLYMTIGPALRQGRAQRRVNKALARAGLPALNDIVLPGRAGLPIQIDHVVRLPTGFVVLETVMRRGRLVGTARSRSWHQDIGLDRHTFGNPLRRLDRAMAAVRRALPPARDGEDPPVVTGQVLLPARARFARGRPEGVALLGEFLESLRDAAEAGADLPPNPANDRAWRVLAEASLARAEGTRDGHWSDVPRRALRHLTADPRTAVGLAFVSAGGLLVLALGVGALT